MRLFMICDNQGNALADQLREPYAALVGQLIANRLASPVWLWDRSTSAADIGREIKPTVTAFMTRKAHGRRNHGRHIANDNART